MRRRRWRTAVLWGGCTLSVLIAAAFTVSGWYMVWGEIRGGPYVGVHGGALVLAYPSARTGAGHSRHDKGLPLALVGMAFRNFRAIPLVYPFAAIALPTMLVWRFVPKFPRGHCRRCGYNLTGLTEARCPECGTGFGRSDKNAGSASS